MYIEIKNDYGTLCCQFDGITLWFCDNGSCELFEKLQLRFHSLYGDSCNIHRLVIDTDKMDIKVFLIGQEEFTPFQVVSWPFFFRGSPDCDLLKFVNLFGRRVLHFTNGRASFVPNHKVRYFSLSK